MAIARSFGKWYGIFSPYRLEAWDKRREVEGIR